MSLSSEYITIYRAQIGINLLERYIVKTYLPEESLYMLKSERNSWTMECDKHFYQPVNSNR